MTPYSTVHNATTLQFVDYTLTVNTSGDGFVNATPAGPLIPEGTEVTLEALPNTGWTFTGWSGGLSGSENPATLLITGDVTVTATFSAIEYTLALTSAGNGSVGAVPAPPYYYDDAVQITATPDPGYRFNGWTGDITGMTNPLTFNITENTTV